MPTILRTSNRIYSELTRGSRIFIIAIPFSVLMVALIAWSDPNASGDLIATSAAVPVMVSYLMIRVIMWLASGLPEPTEEDKRILAEEHRKTHTTAIAIEVRSGDDGKSSARITITRSGLLAVAFVLSVWCTIAGSISAGVFWGLGITKATTEAILIVKWILMLVAGSAVLLCLTIFCRAALIKIAKLSHEIFEDPFSMFHGRA
jgi:hypothetical protein